MGPDSDMIMDPEKSMTWTDGKMAPVAADGDIGGYNAAWVTTLIIRELGPGGLAKIAADKSGEAWKAPEVLAAATRVQQMVKGGYVIDGYAASAASWVALAADEVIISTGGMIMIHNANTIAYGNARDLQDTAALLEKIDGILVATYAEATGQDPQQIAEWMAAETWFTAEEAVQKKFADRIATDSVSAQNNVIQWNLTAWTNAPVTNHPSSRKSVPLDHLRRRLRLAEAQNA